MGEKFEFSLHDALSDIGGDIIENEEFYGCCGAMTIYGFPQSSLASLVKDVKDYWKEAAEEWVFDFRSDVSRTKAPKMPTDAWFRNQLMTTFLKEINEDMVEGEKGRVDFIILSQEQLWLKKTLLMKGFRLVSDRTVNKKTDNRLYVFIRDPLTPKGKKITKKVFSR